VIGTATANPVVMRVPADVGVSEVSMVGVIALDSLRIGMAVPVIIGVDVAVRIASLDLEIALPVVVDIVVIVVDIVVDIIVVVDIVLFRHTT